MTIPPGTPCILLVLVYLNMLFRQMSSHWPEFLCY